MHPWCANASTGPSRYPTNAMLHQSHPRCGRDLRAPINMNWEARRRPAQRRVVLGQVRHRPRMEVPRRIGQPRYPLTESWWGYPSAPALAPLRQRSIGTALPPSEKSHPAPVQRRHARNRKSHCRPARVATLSYTRLHTQDSSRDISQLLGEARSQSCRAPCANLRSRWCQ